MKASHPTAFLLKKRQAPCAVCTNIAPCPACPKGQQCQQIFRTSCQDCPVNKCVPIPGYDNGGGTNKSALGGGLAALVIIAIAAAIGFGFWRRLKAKRCRRIALHQDAMQRREKVKNEKEGATLQLGGGTNPPCSPHDPNNSPFAIVDADDLDNDTEYTQVTGVLNDQDRLGSLVEPTAFRRRSFGAATHLSRITEGMEEEEEEIDAEAAAKSAKRKTAASVRSNAHSLASRAGPRVSFGSGISFGSGNIIPIAFKPSPSYTSGGSVAESEEESMEGYQPVSLLAVPLTAHRATGAPAIQVNTARTAPIRPTRAPDLNLKLPETQKYQPTPSWPLATITNTTAATKEARYDFMSVDPVSALTASGPYSRSNRPLSGATINTINSAHSNSLSYVMSAPQVITPVSGDRVRRVQLGNGGKAQLVKVPSLKRKDKSPEAPNREDPFQDQGEAELLPPPTNRFGSSPSGERSSTISTSTLGIPFGENPFGQSIQPPENQASPSDAEERSSWLGSSTDIGVTKRSSDPFKDPTRKQSGESGEEEVRRASIGGLSLLGQFPFDFSRAQLPDDAAKRVEQYKR
ncbi:hypothetical protein NDA14_003016 [Ustilago hordei]|nr:hypothetical protein NDA12_001364 [Ustilago hordei]KAJ1597750.1 hypothetical protein NDA14_003016 [Ustilago hordei]